MNVLVAGGGGYIGSHMVRLLVERGHKVITLDSLLSGYRDAILGGDFVQADLLNAASLNEVFKAYQIDAVMHFAGVIAVGESVLDPGKYYQNNLVGTINLLDAMRRHGVDKFVFSSTAAVFGNPQYVPIDENHPQAPINPYGRSKWMIEQVLGDYRLAYGMRSVVLRYFNAAGASPDAMLGERHEPETHLIPLALRAAMGKREALTVYGTDYETPDGTCVRDYIHILDLCDAHLKALDHLDYGGEARAYNLGNGEGYSVNQVVQAIEKVTAIKVPVVYGERRLGDPPFLVADATKIRKDWGWEAQFPELEQIILHAWQWERKQTFS